MNGNYTQEALRGTPAIMSPIHKKYWTGGRINIRGISEFISAIAIGTAFGIYVNECNHNSLHIGQETYQIYRTQNPGNCCTHPPSAILTICLWVLVALVVFTVYEALAYSISQVFYAFMGKRGTEQR